MAGAEEIEGWTTGVALAAAVVTVGVGLAVLGQSTPAAAAYFVLGMVLLLALGGAVKRNLQAAARLQQCVEGDAQLRALRAQAAALAWLWGILALVHLGSTLWLHCPGLWSAIGWAWAALGQALLPLLEPKQVVVCVVFSGGAAAGFWAALSLRAELSDQHERQQRRERQEADRTRGGRY